MKPLLNEAFSDKKYDTRVIHRNNLSGVLSDAEVEKYLKSLPDESAHAEYVSLETIAQDTSKK